MQIPVGEQVVILDSGIIGVIEYYNGSTAYINVNGEIHQAHKKDIASVSEFGGKGKSTIKKEELTQAAKDIGLFIHWRAVKSMGGDVDRFEVELVNNTPLRLLFEYKWYLLEELQTTVRNTITPNATIRLHGMKPDAINDRPVSTLQCWRQDDKGITISVADSEVKLRPKQYVTKLSTEPYLSSGIIVFPVNVSDSSLQIPASEKKPTPAFNFNEKKKVPVINEVLQKAAMPDYIDLHVEKLLPSHKHLSSTEILAMQISQFRHFLEKAIRLKLHRIYAIHGHGKGVLRTEIEKTLKKYPEVTSYNNDYNPRFGHGATEIILD
ncbi:MAG TPA: Smr/MutS family protein [Chitinophagales bacterium]|nr:Smr/MutS family protein [Chitinophagales bacterium]HMX03042.1 Smr/MutS family protein [Chitinophagales bacterium]HNE45813.1 Smr/MutS family protein [Chitinophagales bacterium]HNF69911.1 Smr/MutS family protein [Chitinophagales bacterium]HNI55287.1 Smr/MutS family protein [Chitinophagales bacterium]